MYNAENDRELSCNVMLSELSEEESSEYAKIQVKFDFNSVFYHAQRLDTDD